MNRVDCIRDIVCDHYQRWTKFQGERCNSSTCARTKLGHDADLTYIPHIGGGIFAQFPVSRRKFSAVGAVLGERDAEKLKDLDL